MGCLSFKISIKPTARMDVEDKGKHLGLDVYAKRTGSMNIGFICTTDAGLPVLYASDGALITIDGKYLIVRK